MRGEAGPGGELGAWIGPGVAEPGLSEATGPAHRAPPGIPPRSRRSAALPLFRATAIFPAAGRGLAGRGRGQSNPAPLSDHALQGRGAPPFPQKLAWRRVILIGRRAPRPATPSRSKLRPLARRQSEASLAGGGEAVPGEGGAPSVASYASSQSEKPVAEVSV